MMKLITSVILLMTFCVVGFSQQNVGAAAQNFTETTITGEKIELEQLKGKVVIISFWSTRCQICAAEIPKLNKLVSKYEGKDVVFIGLTNNNEEMVKNYLKKKPFDFKIITNGFGVLLKYADRDSENRLNMGYPAHFVVDRKGKVVLKTSGFKKADDLDNKISKLLSE
ncbi:MAG: TlpA family protein disulfide reductase [Aridibacter sp.]